MRKIAVAGVVALVLVGACVAFSRMRPRSVHSSGHSAVTVEQGFSADHVMTQILPSGANPSMTMKLYQEGVKLRDERQTRRGPKITIMRPDIGKRWTIYPSEQTYTETPLIGNEPRKPILDEMRQQIPDVKETGSSVVNGRNCTRYKGTVTEAKPDPRMAGGDRKTEITTWVDPELNLAVKTETKELSDTGDPICTIVDEYRNIRVEAQPDSLFELPKGYRQVEPPPTTYGMPPMQLPTTP